MKDNKATNKSGACQLSKTIATLSKLFGQWGLGTLYAQFENISYFKDKRCLITKFDNVCFEIRAFDSYWAPYLIGDRVYEAEIDEILKRLALLEVTFIDCGANIGYWSAIVSSAKFGWKNVIAIEANPTTFTELQRNAELNNNRFSCRFGAIFNQSGEKVLMENAAQHAVTHIGNSGVEVTTLTIDELVADGQFPKDNTVIIKLDVEGAEIAAIEGARQTQKSDHAFIYEDWMAHSFPVTHYLLEQGYYIYGVTKNGNCVLLKSIEEANRFQQENFKKQGPLRQYGPLNNVACKEGKVLTLMEKWAVKCCSGQTFHTA